MGKKILERYEEQGRTAVQLAKELFALAEQPHEKLVTWVEGLNWHEKRLAEAVMMMSAEDMNFSLDSISHECFNDCHYFGNTGPSSSTG